MEILTFSHTFPSRSIKLNHERLVAESSASHPKLPQRSLRNLISYDFYFRFIHEIVISWLSTKTCLHVMPWNSRASRAVNVLFLSQLQQKKSWLFMFTRQVRHERKKALQSYPRQSSQWKQRVKLINAHKNSIQRRAGRRKKAKSRAAMFFSCSCRIGHICEWRVESRASSEFWWMAGRVKRNNEIIKHESRLFAEPLM